MDWTNDRYRTYANGDREQMFGDTNPMLAAKQGYVSPGYYSDATPENYGDFEAKNVAKWLTDRGYQTQYAQDGSNNLSRLVDAGGNQVGDPYSYRVRPDDAFGLATLATSGVVGVAAAGAAGAGAAAGGAGAGGGSAASTGALGTGVGYTVPGAAAGGSGGLLGGAAGTAGGVGGGTAAAGGLLSGLGDYAGYAQLAAPILGAVLGANGNQSSQTSRNEIDPRIAKYLYGLDGSGGLLGNVGKLYDQQMATGGLNPLQQQGIESQRQTLMDPRYMQGYEQMRALGGGLLGQQVAGNPFTSGQVSLQRPGGLLGGA